MATVLGFGRTRAWFRAADRDRWMPLVMAGALWVAETVGTATGTWAYSGQGPGHLVSLARLGPW